MRITTQTLMLVVTIVALGCIIAVQNYHNGKRIASLETELKRQEIELAELNLRLYHSYAAWSVEEESPESHAEALLFYWTASDLLLKHMNSISREPIDYVIFDSDPAERARQLNAKNVFDEKFVEDQRQRLLDQSDEMTLEYINMVLELDSYWQKKMDEGSPDHAILTSLAERLKTKVASKSKERQK